MNKKISYIISAFLFASAFISCGSDAADLAQIALNPPGRKTIDRSMVGVNNFFVHPEFGSISEQYSEIRDTLGVKFIRVLFAWTDDVQPSPNTPPNYGFYDDIIDAAPPGVDILVVLSHTPSWMADPANWVGGNPRTTWTEKWLKPTVSRYAGHGRIVGWEVWNEPDLTTVPSDAALELTEAPKYFELLQLGSAAIRGIDPGKLVLNAATTSIQADFPETLNFNIYLRDAGAEALIDRWNMHYYGRQFENVVRSTGVTDFFATISKPVWLTESGEQGPEQLAYAETIWPFLKDEIPTLERIYQYQFADTVPLANNFGLKTTDDAFPVSDLYVYLRDNK